MDWEKVYKQKLVTVEEAAKVIKSNDRIYSTTMCSQPVELLKAISDRYLELENVVIFSALSLYPYDFLFKPEYKGHIKYHATFIGGLERKYYPYGNIELTTHHFSKADWIARNRIKANVMVCEVSPPDENGNMSFGPVGTYNGRTVAENAETIIAQVNKKTPYVYGSEKAFINVNEVTHICEVDRDILELVQAPATEVEEKIASYIYPLIEDGSTIQIGVGGIANSVGYSLMNHKDLGVHTEMLTDCLVDLAKKGVINGSKKTINKGKMVICFGAGKKELYDFMHKNDMVEAHHSSYVNDINVIAAHKKFVSINSCLVSDLTGQVGSETLGFKTISLTGGQLDFVRGSFYSEGGKSFLCMPSTATDAQGNMISRITAALPPGTVVTTPRADVQYIVTEYGIADLKERSHKERVEAMVSIAHPKFRDELIREAKKYGIIY